MRLRKSWLRVKSVSFDFSAKSSSTDYNELNKTTPKSVAHIGSDKSFVELGIPKNELFHFFTFFALLKVYFSLWAMSGVKSSTDYNGSNNPNPKSVAHIESEESLVNIGVLKNELFHFFHSTEKFTFSP